MKIVADDKIPFLKGVLEPFARVEYYPGNEISREKILDADALIIRTRTQCKRELLEGNRVKLIATATIGFDHIDTGYCEQHAIRWLNAPGCNSSSVQQYMTAALLHLAEQEKFRLQEKTIGIIGVGNVGKKVEQAATALGMNVLLNDPPRQRAGRESRFVSLETIQNEADIITFHVPLNKHGADKTFHLADSLFFNGLKKSPVIINTSRGEVIETTALKNAIRKHKVEACILDVWENEPNIDPELLQLAELATPHIAGYSADGKANGTSICVNAVSRFFSFGIGPDWYPAEIPQAEQSNTFEIDCSGKSAQAILYEAVLHTYPIQHDCRRLKKSPGTFEQQRGDYPVRREFPNYTVKLINPSPASKSQLRALGFKIPDDR
ncbi:MAG: 4-phosphoerythronate dehydrogenase PdxB [Gammaproteobacteria bacterium]|nr:4-phosphoerythronate dehydrogenase PdxB [Gammaproteobacteria bacterium]